MRRGKLIALVIFAVLAIVVILQNRESATAHILFVSITMPRALLLLLTLLMGFAMGALTTGMIRRGKW